MRDPRKAWLGRVGLLLSVASLWFCGKRAGTTATVRHRLAAAVEQCDPAGYIGCIRDAALVSVPIVNTGLSLTYTSDPFIAGAARGARRTLDSEIGGWSINTVDTYDADARVLGEGDGSWHEADAVHLPTGERAVPSYDGAVAYIFDSAGRHVRTVDGHHGAVLVRITYDVAGRVTGVSGSFAGRPVHVSVDRGPDGEPRSLVGIDGGTTTLSTDTAGRLISVTDPTGAITQISWGADGRVASVTNPLGAATRYAYDAGGGLSSVTDADSVVSQFARKDLGNGFEVRVSTPLDRHWVYRAESVDGGVRRTLIAPDGSASTETTDRNGARTLRLADATTYAVGAVASPIWGMAAPVLTPIVETRSDGVISRRDEKDALQPHGGLPYVVAGLITTTLNGQDWVQTFDPVSRSVTLVDPAGRRSMSTFDGDGHLVHATAPGVAPISYAYDAQGRVTRETIGSGALAETRTYRFDPATGNAVVARADGTTETTLFDGAGRSVSTTDGGGAITSAARNAAGSLTLLVPSGGAVFALGTSPAGRPTAFVPPSVANDSSVEITSYDRDGDVAAITGLGNRTVNVIRDAAGRVIGTTFNRGKLTIAYDQRSGRVTQATDPSGVTATYGFAGDVLDRLAWSGPITGSVADSIDASGRSIAEVVDGATPWKFAYDGSGALTGVGPLSLTRDPTTGLVTHTAVGAVETTAQYDENARLSRATATASGKAVFDQRYTRDARGRVRAVIETMSGQTSTTEYAYDRAGRLASVRVNGRVVETNSYDGAGNRIAVTRPAGTITASYDDRHRALSWGTVRYDWAPDGTLRRRIDGSRAMALVYDDFGSLVQTTLPDGRSVTYLVDAEGRRVACEIAGKLVAGYLYRPDGLIAAEVDAAGRVVATFGYDDDQHLALVERGGDMYRVITDPIGSPRLVIDSRTGAVAAAMTYDAWGVATRTAGAELVPIGFAGGLRDSTTRLVRFGARDYDPETGRWMAADPIRFDGGDANLYRYAADDPVNRVDPTGMAPPKGGGKGGNPPNTGKPPNTNPPPTNPTGPGNPTPNKPPPGPGNQWSCSAPTGACQAPGNSNGASPWGCEGGSCGSNNGNFWCKARICRGPGGDLCIGSPCTYGEPHFQIGRSSLDFQAAGEFLAATSPDGKFAVQVRQQAIWPGAQVALNSAIAANVNGDRVGVYSREPSYVVIGDQPVNEPEFILPLQHGGTVVRHGGTVDITWPDESRVTVVRIGDMLNLGIRPSASRRSDVGGLLFNADTSRTHTLVGRDGAALSATDPAFGTKMYQQFGNSWRIKPSESLFHYWRGESSARFTDLTFPTKPLTAASLPAATRSRAEGICRAVGVQTQPTLDACILDVGVTGSPAMAAASLAAAGNPSTAEVAPAPGAVPGSGPTHSGAGTYAIKIGDTISPDQPAPGAGIATPAQHSQIYTFQAHTGDIVYVQASSCQGARLDFTLNDATNQNLDGRTGCGDFGPVTLRSAGVYRLVVHADTGTARYTFVIRMTTSDFYSIKIGDTVSPDHPAPGSGIITKAGQRQTYTFPARAGDIVYVQVGPCEGASIGIDLYDSAGRGFGGHAACGDFGPVSLPAAGTYHIVVHSDQSTARYTFVVRPTTSDTYSIKMGETVSPNHPTPGAGVIGLPGQRQSYRFPARAGDIVYVQAGPCEPRSLAIELWDSTQRALSGTAGCGDFGPVTLPGSGTYHILVHSDSTHVQYTFTVRSTTLDKYTIKIGDTVSPNRPASGAGIIALLGEQQEYSFPARAGQTISIHAGPCDGARLGFDVFDPANHNLGGKSSCGDFLPIKLPANGMYRIVVSADRGAAHFTLTIR